ncbi:hypothetical protein GINT2_000462 [Glugoides intestinalis]
MIHIQKKYSKVFYSYSDVARILDGKDTRYILNFILSNIHCCNVDDRLFSFVIRKVKPVFEYFMCRENFYDNSTSYLILSTFVKILQEAEIKYCIFQEHFSDHDISEIFELLTSFPEKIKNIMSLFIETMANKFIECTPLLEEIIENRLLRFQNLEICFSEIVIDFKLLTMLITTERFCNDLESYYTQFILNCILKCSTADILISSKLLESICLRVPECQIKTFKYFIKVYYKSTSIEQLKIVEMTTSILNTALFAHPKNKIQWEFCQLLNFFLKSDNYLVVDVAIEMLEVNIVKKFIIDNFRSILPLVFESIYKLSKKFWKREQKYKAIQTIGNILRIDSTLFEDCLIKYNKSKVYYGEHDSTLDDERYYINKIKGFYHKFS